MSPFILVSLSTKITWKYWKPCQVFLPQLNDDEHYRGPLVTADDECEELLVLEYCCHLALQDGRRLMSEVWNYGHQDYHGDALAHDREQGKESENCADGDLRVVDHILRMPPTVMAV